MSYSEQIVIDRIHAQRDQGHMMKAEFDRDMSRLKDLRDKHDSPGLNTYEHNEVKDLLDKYDIEMTAWTRREMFL